MTKSVLFAVASLWVVVADLSAQTIALRGGTVYIAPDQPPIVGGTVVLHAGKIAAVGASVLVPGGAQVIDVTGKYVTAGFWNSHVHFQARTYGGADTVDARILTTHLTDMLGRWGFTSVFDTGSPLANTLALRKRISTGEVLGPRILTAGDVIYPKGAQNQKYQVSTAAEALAVANELIAGGASAIKLYAQAWWDLNLVLPPDAIRAVVDLARARGLPVFAHPSHRRGLQNAVDNGVNILVHTTPQIGPWSDSLLTQMKARNIALIPTLSLWRFELQRDNAPGDWIETFVDRGVAQLRQYFEAGGSILFGTDVGYMTDFSTQLEYELMTRAGMGYRDVLAALTTVPAERHGAGAQSGRIAVGYDADVVVLNTNPASDIRAFADVQYVFREGRLIYKR